MTASLTRSPFFLLPENSFYYDFNFWHHVIPTLTEEWTQTTQWVKLEPAIRSCGTGQRILCLEKICMKRSHAFSTLITQGLMGRLQNLLHATVSLRETIFHIHVMIKWQLSKQGIRWPVLHDLIAGLSVDPFSSRVFLKSSADMFLVFNWSQAQDFFSTHTAHKTSCAYEPAAGLRTRNVSLFTGREGSGY